MAYGAQDKQLQGVEGGTGSSTGETRVINKEPWGCGGHPVTVFAS